MGESRTHDPVLLVLVAFSQSSAALDWAKARASEQFGPIAFESDAFDFTQTDYYAESMGTELTKQFYVFERLIDPSHLARLKHRTNDWEIECSASAESQVDRLLNLDPGYLTQAKFVLATTKDREHRLYVGDGMFAEITLSYYKKQWQAHPWTYPDFRTAAYREFLLQARDYYTQQLRVARRQEN